MNTPTWEEKLTVELNYDILKTIQILQADLQIFKYDNMNEIKEQKEINEDLLRNMTRRSPQEKTTHSTNKFKKEFHHKRERNPNEEGKQEHNHEPPERDYQYFQ